jgi:hypothetical protein
LSEELTGKTVGLMERAENLRKNISTYYQILTSRQVYLAKENVVKTYFGIYKIIRDDVIKSFHLDAIVYGLPSLTYEDNHRAEFLRLVAGLDQVIGFLKGKQVDVLGTRVRKFPIKEKELDILPSVTKMLLLEAIGEYDYNHSYACCCICGLAFESLVKEGCEKNNLQYKGLANGIKALKEAKVIKEDLHKSLMGLEKYYRDKISAHLTSEVATDENARLFLSSLLSLGKAIFAK